MRLTAVEQGSIAVRALASEAEGCLDPRQAAGLVELGERIGARVLSWQTPNRLRVGQFVGVVHLGDLQLEILPKLEGLPGAEAVRKNLLAMLALTEDLEVQASEVVGFLEADEPFVRALARLYCRRLLEFVRRGLRQEYLPHEDVLPHVRGKIDWPARARLAVTQRLDFPCRFDDRSEDTPLNRTLKAALLEAEEILGASGAGGVVTELRHAMGEVSDSCPGPLQLERLHTDRMSRNLEPVLVLAKLILGNRSPDLGRSALGDQKTYALVWDMNVLFEEYIGRVCAQVLGAKGLRVDLQERASAYLAEEVSAKLNAFLLRPDILVREGRKTRVVADTKWKRLGAKEPNLGVSSSDVYQVLAYARRYDLDQAVLVYPHDPSLGAPGLKREFLTRSADAQKVRIRILTVDLARLAEIPGQLEEGLGRPPRGEAA